MAWYDLFSTFYDFTVELVYRPYRARVVERVARADPCRESWKALECCGEEFSFEVLLARLISMVASHFSLRSVSLEAPASFTLRARGESEPLYIGGRRAKPCGGGILRGASCLPSRAHPPP